MAQTTGIILAIGGITVVNETVFNNRPLQWRVPVATGLAAVVFAGGERLWPQGVKMLAWTALLTVALTRTDPAVPSPVESALAWWDKAPAKTTSSSKAPGAVRAV